MSSRFGRILLFFFSALVSLHSFGQTNVSGSVSGIWTKANSPYVLTGTIDVPTGQTLTIQPGVIIEFPRYDWNLNVSGTLLAQGTAADSIRFRGKANLTYDANSTHGGVINFYAGSTASVLEYVSIEQMGDVSTGGVAVQVSRGITPVLRHTTMRNSEVDDVRTWVGGAENFANVRAIVVINDGTGNQDATMAKLGYSSFYRLLNSISVNVNYSLTIQPGVVVESSRYDWDLNVYGTLLAQGTAADSIRFRGKANPSYDANSTHGGGINFYAGSTASTLDYVSIEQMGDASTGGAAIYVGSGITPALRHTTIRNSEVDDVRTWVGGAENFANVRAIVVINDGTGNQDATMAKLGYSSFYRFVNSISVNAGYKLIIQPGVTVESPRYDWNLNVSGTLLAQGTAADSIRFRGKANPSHDVNSSHGGAINFYAGSTASVLEYVSINQMGDASTGGEAIRVFTSSLSVTQSSVRNSENIGINIATTGISPTVSAVRFAANGRDIDASPSSVGGISSLTSTAVHLRAESTNTSCVIPKPGPGSYYQIEGNITVTASTTATVQPGAELRATSFYGRIDTRGSLVARGTVTDSVRFVGYSNTAVSASSSHGGQLYFADGSTGSVLDYVVVDRWGDASTYPNAVDIASSATVSITRSSVRNAESVGIAISSSSVSVTNSLVHTNAGTGINIAASGISPVITAVRFMGNVKDIDASPSSVGGISSLTSTAVHLRAESTNTSCVIPKPGPGSYYQIEGNITVTASTTATIQPGAELRATSFYGRIDTRGSLVARGTVTDSVRFVGYSNTAVSASSSHGGQLYFADGSTGSVLDYVVVDRWGDASTYPNAVDIASSATVSITRSSVRNAESVGIAISSSSVSVTNSLVHTNAGTGINIAASGISPVITAVRFMGNVKDIDASPSSVGGISSLTSTAVHLRAESTNTSCVIPKPGPGSYYQIEGNITVTASTTATIQPGAELRATSFYGRIDTRGSLVARGTVTDSVRFVGYSNTAVSASSSHGGQLYFADGSTGSVLEYVVVDRWGDAQSYGTAIGIYSSSVSISKSMIRNVESVGINVERTDIIPSIQENNFSANATDIASYPSSFGGILNNTNAKVSIRSGNVSTNATWPIPGANSYYQLTSQVTVDENYTLTIEAGSLVDFGTNGIVYVRGALRAIGTESAPVQLTRLESTTAVQYYGFVYLYPSSTNSTFNYVTIDKLGSNYYGYAALDIRTPNFSISNTTISNSQNSGLQYSAAGSPLITSSNFFNNKTGVYVTQGRPTFTNCNIYGNTDFGINNVSSAVSDTVDARSCYWGTTSGPNHPSLNPAGTGNKVSNKVRFNPWGQQPFNGQIADIGVSAILRPSTDCNFSASDSIAVCIRNFGNVGQSNFPVSYRINTGAVITETITSSLLPGRTIDYIFRTKANLSAVGSYTISAYTSLPADTLPLNNTVQAIIQHLPGIALPTNLLPANNATDIDVAVALSWAAVPNATAYDLFVWKATDAVPTQPLVANLTQIAYTVSYNNLQYGTQYRWKVVAKRVSCRAESVVQTFTTRQLPDLVVQSINAPAAATSETDVTLSWRVLNQGTGSTQSQTWTDLIYLSDQPTLGTGSDDFYVGSRPNFSALNAGQSYQAANLTYRIPQGVQGQYYVIVRTNPSQYLREVSYTNNERVSGVINIALAPPPDLQVTSVVVNPLNTFSEETVTVTYTVRNAGTGPTSASYWTDYILLSPTETLNLNTARNLTSYARQQALPVNGTYTVTSQVKLPERIGGTYYIHIVTDRFGQVYEYTNEENNSRTSLALNVTQRPTPNLTVSGITVSATAVASNQPLTIGWTTANAGALTAQPTWQESIYLSSDGQFNANSDRVVGTFSRTDALPSLGSVSGQQSVTIPSNLAEGDYYFFVRTDAGDQIYENPDEADNVTAASALVRVQNPDLRPTALTAPTSATSEQAITVQWRVLNDSPAGLFNASWTDQIYLSTNNTLEPGTDVLLTGVSANQLVAGGGEYSRQTTVTLPVGVSGSYNLLLITDGGNSIFEKTETNNSQAVPITITLAPWPDLVVSSIVAPATDTVGTSMSIRYATVNNGSVSLVNRQWRDNVYVSPTPTVNEASLIYVGSVSQNQSLSNGQSFTQVASFSLPTNLVPGRYYVVVRTDADNAVFEHTSEGNNTTVASTSTVIGNLPAIDLAVTAGSVLSTSVTAGSPVTVQWTVKNNSAFATIVPTWQDAIYLSTNPVLDASDALLATVTVSTSLAAGASYIRTQTVTIPAETGGTLYLLVTTDKDNRHNDDRRGNNTLPLNSGSGQTVTVTIPPPADLVPISFLGPTEGTVSQPINVTFTVRNAGTGPTPSGNWTDQVYLSTDLQVGNDISVGSFSHSGTLAPGAEYTVSGQVFLPGNVSGNYVLLLRTDAGDNVFERNGEGNNVAFANIVVNPQPPSDLRITQIDLPAGDQFAGSNVTISWQLTNAGANAANGYSREAVYLSRDTTLDVNDVLFGTLDGSNYLPPQATETRTLTRPLSNVVVGNYYVFVKTDILNNIVEQNENNNQAMALNQLPVKVKELALNVRTTDTLTRDVPLYYRIEIPPGLVGETLSIVLKGDSTSNAVNRLFVRKDSVPTTNRFDFVANVPFRANQEVLIPSLQAGTYYLMGLGNHPTSVKQPVSLLARVIPFSITSVDANRGGNTGLVTVKLIGAKFEPGMTVTLAGSVSHVATAVYYTDPSKLYATFNLSGAPTGQYTIQVRKSSGAVAQLPNGFTVVTGTPGGVDGALQLFTCNIQNIGFDENIDVDVLAPTSVRRGQKAKITIAYANVGNVDIPAQTRILLSLEGAPLDFSTAFLQQRKELFLEFIEVDGPPGILRAGSSGFVNVYTHAIAPIALVITQ